MQKQQWYYLTDIWWWIKGFIPFLKDVSQKVNAKVWLKLKSFHFEAIVQHFSYYNTRISSVMKKWHHSSKLKNWNFTIRFNLVWCLHQYVKYQSASNAFERGTWCVWCNFEKLNIHLSSNFSINEKKPPKNWQLLNKYGELFVLIQTCSSIHLYWLRLRLFIFLYLVDITISVLRYFEITKRLKQLNPIDFNGIVAYFTYTYASHTIQIQAKTGGLCCLGTNLTC